MSDKVCVFCGVGWMTVSRAKDFFGRWWWVWDCSACGKQEKVKAE